MEITAVDVHDDAALERWFGPMDAAHHAAWPDDPGWTLHELSARMRRGADTVSLLAVAEEATSTIGALRLELPGLENRHLAELWLAVHPDHRGRGVGSVLLAHAEALARAEGRTTVVANTETPVGAPEGADRERFPRAHGYQPARIELRRTLQLPLPPGLLDRLEASHANDGYEVVTWTVRCPDRLVEGRVAAARAMSTDAPQGDLDLEEERWDVARLRRHERTVDAMGREALAAGAVDADGNLVGFTELGVSRSDPAVAYQFDTVVLPAHRGHGLGLRLKVANLRELVARSPATTRVHTWNARTNAFMARVNDALGFVDTGVETSWQKVLA